jgi:PAS domain S-box-containing protein
MPAVGGKFLSRFYSWTIKSVYRIAAMAVVLALLLLTAANYMHPAVFGTSAAVILFGLGAAAYAASRSGTALEYPGIDRFFQQVPCYLSIQDRKLNIVRTNREFRRDFGDRIGEKCYFVYKGREDICPNCPVIKTFDDGKTYSSEETVITKDGQPAQMIVYTTPVFDEEGRIAGVMEMSTNITEIKNLQNQIEASHQEYRDLFERVPCYISVVDKDLRIIRTNERFKREFGDPTGKQCFEVFKNRDSACPDCHALKTIEDGRIHSTETTVLRKDGTPARLVAYTSPLHNDRGEITAVMEMSTDISQIRRLEAELANMGKTIAVMAHRIKNILMGLEGGIFVVNTGVEGGDDMLFRKGWGMIQRNVEKVSRIVKDLLYCSREREMNFELIDPAPVIHGVYELFCDRALKEGIEFGLEAPESLPSGNFDSEALESLLTNLVINAFDACLNDATEGKSSHRIVIRVTFEKKNRKHIFEVEDNGSGIPGHVGEAVFEDFFSTKGREGTGLGLLVAQKIVEEHGGIITFRSDEGRGTAFTAIIPLKNK